MMGSVRLEAISTIHSQVSSSLRTSLQDVREAQARFFLSGATRSCDFRISQLEKLLTGIKDRHRQITEAIHRDLGKPSAETTVAEIATVCGEITYVIKHLKKWMRIEKVPTPLPMLPARSHVRREPLGKVLLISPWNYPFQLALTPLVGALSAGNTAVLKLSEHAPHTAEMLVSLLNQLFDERLVAVFLGDAKVASSLLDQPWDHIFFTGSPAVGRIVAAKAAEHLCPVTLELGGKSPCIVDSSCNLTVSARRIAWSKFFNVGQTCIAPDYVLVQSDIKARFIDSLTQAVTRLYGEQVQQSADYGRIVSRRHLQRLLALLKDQKIVFGGRAELDQLYLEPTIVDEPSHASPLMAEEIFGPILPVLSFHSVDDAIRLINSKDKPLALYVYAEDRSKIERILSQVSFGGGMVNDGLAHAGNHHLPFGGVGKSGTGSYHGRYSFETFSHRKAVMDMPTAIDVPLRYPPYSTVKEKLLRSVFGL